MTNTTIRFGADPQWGTIRTYHTDCADCGQMVRIQSEHSTDHEGNPRPAPTVGDEAGMFCPSCGFNRLQQAHSLQATTSHTWDECLAQAFYHVSTDTDI